MKVLRKLLFLALIAPVLLFGLFLIANAYARHRLNQRMDYWAKEMQQTLPIGAPLSNAQGFFRSRGVLINCRQAADGSTTCSGRDAEAYGVLPTWHIRFKLTFSDNVLVSSERIALGVGL